MHKDHKEENLFDRERIGIHEHFYSCGRSPYGHLPPDVVRGGRKGAFFGVLGSVVFLIGGFWIALTYGRGDILQAVGIMLFATVTLFVFLLQLVWGPLISMNEQKILLRPNPFFKRIEMQWEEIEAFIPFTGRNHFFFDVILSPAHREAFLLRQSPFMRKILTRRLERSHRIARFSQLVLPCAQTDLRNMIQELYHIQVQKYHIHFKK